MLISNQKLASTHFLPCFLSLLLAWESSLSLAAEPANDALPQRAEQTLRKAVGFYREQVAIHGGYPYYSRLDLQQRWGEGELPPHAIIIQPPGTPTVGISYLKAYEATGDKFFLAAAQETAESLIRGRLASGGWSQVIQFDASGTAIPPKKQRSSLDDGQTQSAIKLLILTDQALQGKQARIHEGALAALQALLDAQFPCGAFPQVWSAPAAKHPILQANYPTYDWKTEGRVKNYWDYYTLNDNLAGSVAETLQLAHRVYRDEKYRTALCKLGDFLLAAQMPAPQPAWCQQYNYEMQPIWARKFEPPAITGWESQDALRTLIAIASSTGEKKYLAPVPPALEYLKSCLLPDGQIARYYELRTNKPLYMTATYELTYDDADVPRHYGWKQPAKLHEIAQLYETVMANQPLVTRSKKPSEKDINTLIEQLDPQGRWISQYNGESLTGQPKFERGFQYLSSEVFSRNLTKLSEYLAGQKR